MTSLCFSPKHSSSSPPLLSSSPLRFMFSPRFSPSTCPSPFSPSRLSFSDSIMDRTLEMAEPIITKWDPDINTLAKVTSLFYENQTEAKDFIKCVNNLQKAMQFLSTENHNSDKLVRAKKLMQAAMKRLEKEFCQILSTSRFEFGPAEFVSTRSSSTSDNNDNKITNKSVNELKDATIIAMSDLRLIAKCMISSGYSEECLKIFKIIRKSIVDDGIYKTGVKKLSASHVHKMEWNALELTINEWLSALTIAVKALFSGERILCDHVFHGSDLIRESCFADIMRDGAMILFGFPENVAKNGKKSPEQVLRMLDMYSAISTHLPEIESMFSSESLADVRNQVVTSLVRLGEYARAALDKFKAVIMKDNTKSPIAGAGIHYLTINVMTYLSILSDYNTVLSAILADSPLPVKHLIPDSYFGFADSDESPASAISLKMAWLILTLLCKLDTKADYYKDVSLSYLFLANNFQYVVMKVRNSNLKYILGDNWLSEHDRKVKQFWSSYVRLGWNHVFDSLPKDLRTVITHDQAKDIFRRFNLSFDQAYHKHCVCIIPDGKLRADVKGSISGNIFPVYREFYNMHRASMGRERDLASVVRFGPKDVAHRLSELFFETNKSLISSSF